MKKILVICLCFLMVFNVAINGFAQEAQEAQNETLSNLDFGLSGFNYGFDTSQPTQISSFSQTFGQQMLPNWSISEQQGNYNLEKYGAFGDSFLGSMGGILGTALGILIVVGVIALIVGLSVGNSGSSE